MIDRNAIAKAIVGGYFYRHMYSGKNILVKAITLEGDILRLVEADQRVLCRWHGDTDLSQVIHVFALEWDVEWADKI